MEREWPFDDINDAWWRTSLFRTAACSLSVVRKDGDQLDSDSSPVALLRPTPAADLISDTTSYVASFISSGARVLATAAKFANSERVTFARPQRHADRI